MRCLVVTLRILGDFILKVLSLNQLANLTLPFLDPVLPFLWSQLVKEQLVIIVDSELFQGFVYSADVTVLLLYQQAIFACQL